MKNYIESLLLGLKIVKQNALGLSEAFIIFIPVLLSVYIIFFIFTCIFILYIALYIFFSYLLKSIFDLYTKRWTIVMFIFCNITYPNLT